MIYLSLQHNKLSMSNFHCQQLTSVSLSRVTAPANTWSVCDSWPSCFCLTLTLTHYFPVVSRRGCLWRCTSKHRGNDDTASKLIIILFYYLFYYFIIIIIFLFLLIYFLLSDLFLFVYLFIHSFFHYLVIYLFLFIYLFIYASDYQLTRVSL